MPVSPALGRLRARGSLVRGQPEAQFCLYLTSIFVSSPDAQGWDTSRVTQATAEHIKSAQAVLVWKWLSMHLSNLWPFQMVKDDYEDESHVFRKAANDITSQLEINFGSLPRPGRGARGSTRGARGRIRRAENYGPRAEVVVSGCTGSPGGLLKERVVWSGAVWNSVTLWI